MATRFTNEIQAALPILHNTKLSSENCFNGLQIQVQMISRYQQVEEWDGMKT